MGKDVTVELIKMKLQNSYIHIKVDFWARNSAIKIIVGKSRN